jgi:hypothetical protein
VIYWVAMMMMKRTFRTDKIMYKIDFFQRIKYPQIKEKDRTYKTMN